MKRIAAALDIEINIDRWMDENLIQVIEEACKVKNLNYRMMHSGAGQDPQIIAPRIPTGMIFVPSIKGISHNPAEHRSVRNHTLLTGILRRQK